MKFRCDCSMRTDLLGNGCQICKTELVIENMPSPEEVANELEGQAFFTADQASYIASEVYQPLLGIIATLSIKIDQLAEKVK